MYAAIGREIAVAGITGAAIGGLAVAAALAFPALLPAMTVIAVPLMVLGFAVVGVRLVKAGRGWYQVWVEGQPLRPLAIHHWIMKWWQGVKEKATALWESGKRKTLEAFEDLRNEGVGQAWDGVKGRTFKIWDGGKDGTSRAGEKASEALRGLFGDSPGDFAGLVGRRKRMNESPAGLTTHGLCALHALGFVMK